MGLDAQDCLVGGQHPEAHVAALQSQFLRPCVAEPESQGLGLSLTHRSVSLAQNSGLE